MNNKDSLGDRMKDYENISRNYLTRKIPVIVRIDGKAFHNFTRGLKKPFDRVLMSAMQDTMLELCKNIQGCVFGYTQSDEITLILTDYENVDTDAWYGYNIQKIASVSASMATAYFNTAFRNRAEAVIRDYRTNECPTTEDTQYAETLTYAIKQGAMFDSRAFSLPKDEVCNCLIWRQQDATRNSIESAGYAYLIADDMYKKNCNEVQELLFSKRGINWNNYPTDCKRGSACYRAYVTSDMPCGDITRNIPSPPPTVLRPKWYIDTDIPIFTQDRNFIDRWVNFDEDRFDFAEKPYMSVSTNSDDEQGEE